jgi:hypothetical protein
MALYGAASIIVEFVLFMALMTLKLTRRHSCHPFYNIISTDVASVHDIFYNTPLVFADGLLEVLPNKFPPAVEFFEGLDSVFTTKWTMYAITLEKRNGKSRLFIGSATNSIEGS